MFSFGFLVQCSRLDLLLKRLFGEKISVGISVSAGFEQAVGGLQPELSNVQLKNWVLPSAELEAGQKNNQIAFATAKVVIALAAAVAWL